MSCAWCAAPLVLSGALLLNAVLSALTACPDTSRIVSRSPAGWLSAEAPHD